MSRSRVASNDYLEWWHTLTAAQWYEVRRLADELDDPYFENYVRWFQRRMPLDDAIKAGAARSRNMTEQRQRRLAHETGCER